jgi:hypothetical protein
MSKKNFFRKFNQLSIEDKKRIEQIVDLWSKNTEPQIPYVPFKHINIFNADLSLKKIKNPIK